MISFKKNSATKGNFKNVVVSSGQFLDEETGEIIDLAAILSSVYGEDEPFDITTVQKFDSDIDIEG